jgi:cytochrome P450
MAPISSHITPQAPSTAYTASVVTSANQISTAFSLPNSANVFSVISKAQHSRKRRILAHAFSDKALRNMEEYFLTHIRTFCSKLGSAGKPLDMTDWCGFLAFDIMGELCFGKTFGILHDGENMFIKDVMEKSAGMSLLVSFWILVWILVHRLAGSKNLP